MTGRASSPRTLEEERLGRSWVLFWREDPPSRHATSLPSPSPYPPIRLCSRRPTTAYISLQPAECSSPSSRCRTCRPAHRSPERVAPPAHAEGAPRARLITSEILSSLVGPATVYVTRSLATRCAIRRVPSCSSGSMPWPATSASIPTASCCSAVGSSPRRCPRERWQPQRGPTDVVALRSRRLVDDELADHRVIVESSRLRS